MDTDRLKILERAGGTILLDIFVRWNAVPAMPGHFRGRNSVPAYKFFTQA
ncbi:MAG: hypothetical protein IT262_07550 [Saprospiraceae bacterium]|nr:hypothetical protein [Saprospiraceae bacterium]